jgi:hypothetical protein
MSCRRIRNNESNLHCTDALHRRGVHPGSVARYTREGSAVVCWLKIRFLQ